MAGQLQIKSWHALPNSNSNLSTQDQSWNPTFEWVGNYFLACYSVVNHCKCHQISNKSSTMSTQFTSHSILCDWINGLYCRLQCVISIYWNYKASLQNIWERLNTISKAPTYFHLNPYFYICHHRLFCLLPDQPLLAVCY